jgi:hypothetical protein
VAGVEHPDETFKSPYFVLAQPPSQVHYVLSMAGFLQSIYIFPTLQEALDFLPFVGQWDIFCWRAAQNLAEPLSAPDVRAIELAGGFDAPSLHHPCRCCAGQQPYQGGE